MEPDQKISVYWLLDHKAAIKKGSSFDINRCQRTIPYAYGRESGRKLYPTGELVVYVCLIPEKPDSRWRNRRARRLWESALLKTCQELDALCGERREDVFSKEAAQTLERQQEFMPEILAAMIYEGRKKWDPSHAVLRLPDEYGLFLTETVRDLLLPYLKKINVVTFISGRSEAAEELENYFYEEYGIVTDYGRMDAKERETYLCIDLTDAAMEEMRNFLDTAVKSGYNTKVN